VNDYVVVVNKHVNEMEQQEQLTYNTIFIRTICTNNRIWAQTCI